jgi:hypothetical protein
MCDRPNPSRIVNTFLVFPSYDSFARNTIKAEQVEKFVLEMFKFGLTSSFLKARHALIPFVRAQVDVATCGQFKQFMNY